MGISQNLLEKLDDYLEKALFYLAALLLLTIASAVFYAVTMRYVFNEPPLWADEAPRVFFLWMSYIGIAVATRRGQNIRVTHFIEKIPPRQRFALEIFMHMLVLIMIVCLFWYNIPILELQGGGRMLSTKWSFVWPYAALSTGCVLMCFYQARLMLRSVREFRAASGSE